MAQTLFYYPIAKERMKKIVTASGMTFKQCARLCGFSRHVFNQDDCPSVRTIIRFCTIMHVSADYILGLKEEA